MWVGLINIPRDYLLPLKIKLYLSYKYSFVKATTVKTQISDGMAMKKIAGNKVLTFDCYGTLIDWDKGIREFFKEILPDKNQQLIEEIIKRWETVQFHLIQGKYLPYEELQNKSFAQTFSEFNLSIRVNLGKKLLEKIPFWSSFPDVYPVLSQLKNRYKLVLISNGPLSILKANVQNMGIEFDKIISAEQIKAYKPSLEVFQYALKKLKTKVTEILHIAAGYKYDIIPAEILGIKTVWVNRKGIPPLGDIIPDDEITKLVDLYNL